MYFLSSNPSGTLIINSMIGGERVRFTIEGRNFEEPRNMLVRRKIRRIVEWNKGYDEPVDTEAKVDKITVEWVE